MLKNRIKCSAYIYMLNINNRFWSIFLLLCDNLFEVGKNNVVKAHSNK